ncbi:MAG: hypothetical protein F6J86_34020 [Symploca sp. SIO1B1]|nr:hypothetical protein [Symploca sp. SIO1C2]NER98787.1 hypothetical protein [Symploca sp. SIO1B1]
MVGGRWQVVGGRWQVAGGRRQEAVIMKKNFFTTMHENSFLPVSASPRLRISASLPNLSCKVL